MKEKWHVRPGEDRLLWSFWQGPGVEGRLWREVPIGGGSAKTRYVDAVIVPGGRPVHEGRRSAPWSSLEGRVLVVEAKQVLDTCAIGQAAAGRVAVEALTRGRPVQVEATIVVGQSDPILEEIADDLGIRVHEVAAATVVTACFHPADDILTALRASMTREGLTDIGEALARAARCHLLHRPAEG